MVNILRSSWTLFFRVFYNLLTILNQAIGATKDQLFNFARRRRRTTAVNAIRKITNAGASPARA